MLLASMIQAGALGLGGLRGRKNKPQPLKKVYKKRWTEEGAARFAFLEGEVVRLRDQPREALAS